jgi:hypothetical protein
VSSRNRPTGDFPIESISKNFVDSIRSHQIPNADILEGHRSTLLSHTANISYRLRGQKLMFCASTESFARNPEANRLVKREYRDPWVVPEHV